MKKLLFIALVTSLLAFTACSSDDQTAVGATDDHHAGESNVEPHGHDEMMEDHHEDGEDVEPHAHEDAMAEDHDDSNEPPHRH